LRPIDSPSTYRRPSTFPTPRLPSHITSATPSSLPSSPVRRAYRQPEAVAQKLAEHLINVIDTRTLQNRVPRGTDEPVDLCYRDRQLISVRSISIRPLRKSPFARVVQSVIIAMGRSIESSRPIMAPSVSFNLPPPLVMPYDPTNNDWIVYHPSLI